METHTVHYAAVAEPCRNFNILSKIVLVDPRDGREKLVLSSFVAAATGNLVLIDTETGVGESLKFPGDAGAWGLLYLEKYGRLLVSTCPSYGYIHSLDLKTRTWAEPLRDNNEKYIWNMALGTDGMVYGGTWPGCALLQYDPEIHVLKNLGRVSENPKNLYSRVYGGVPGHIIVTGGVEQPVLRAWNIDSRTYTDFGTPGATVKQITDEFICTDFQGESQFYDPKTFEPLEFEKLKKKPQANLVSLPDGSKSHGLKLGNGKLAGVRGQEYYIAEPDGGSPVLRRIPVDAPPTGIHTLTSDSAGIIWGATGFGQTIFSYNLEDGTYWNSNTVCNHGGEVYGMQFAGGKLYLSAYSGGDHVVYDPSQPWNQMENVNPKTLRSVYPDLIRPTGWSVLGPDGGVWTGWSAKYGTYGGGLSRIDTQTHEVASWYDPIPGQQVSGLTADDTYIYFATNGGASGLAYNENVNCHFAVWSPEGRLVHKIGFDQGIRLGFVLAVGGKVLVPAGNEILVFDPQSMDFVRRVDVGEACGWMVAVDAERAVIFGSSDLLLFHVQTGEYERLCTLPGQVEGFADVGANPYAATITNSGELYFAQGPVLFKLANKL